MKDDLSFESSVKSAYGFDDPLLIALESSGKSLSEIQTIIMPWGKEKSEEMIIVNGQEFGNDEKSFSGRSQKRVRIREILDASFAAKEEVNGRYHRALEKKRKLAKEKNATEMRYKYISEVAKREFGITPSTKRKHLHDFSNPNNYKHSKKALKGFDCGMSSFSDAGDDEEIFSPVMKTDTVKQEIKTEPRPPDIAFEESKRRLKRLNRPRPKMALIKKEFDNPQSDMYSSGPQMKGESSEDRIHLATPSSTPEFVTSDRTVDSFWSSSDIHDRVTRHDDGVKTECSNAVKIEESESNCEYVYSSLDRAPTADIGDYSLGESDIDEFAQYLRDL